MTTESGISNTDNILGDPRKSLMVMVVPIAIGMLVQALNNLVDAIWVSSLGTGALAATGVVFPFFFILVGIGNGLGVGASQAIARRIGTGDRAGASAAAAQVMVIGVIVGVVMTAVFAFLAEPIFTVAGAGPYLEETLAYGIPIMLCSPIYMVSFIFSALLRSEGAAKKSMYIQVAGVAAHMVLDPILIFGLDMGITGAAVASALAMAMASLMAVRYYLSGDMYVRFSFRGFRFDRDLDRDILRVGIPASLEMVLLSLSSMLMNLILESVDPVSGIAIYSSGWRILNILTMIAVSFGSALVPISAAAYGQRSYGRIREVYLFALKRGIAVMHLLRLVRRAGGGDDPLPEDLRPVPAVLPHRRGDLQHVPVHRARAVVAVRGHPAQLHEDPALLCAVVHDVADHGLVRHHPGRGDRILRRDRRGVHGAQTPEAGAGRRLGECDGAVWLNPSPGVHPLRSHASAIVRIRSRTHDLRENASFVSGRLSRTSLFVNRPFHLPAGCPRPMVLDTSGADSSLPTSER